MKKSTNKTKVFAAVIVIIVVAIATYIGTSKTRAYSSALKAIDNGNYLSSISILENLSGYKEADILLDQSWYGAAKDYYDNRQYVEALSAIDKISNPVNVEGVDDLKNLCTYEYGKELMDSEKYDEAHKVFSSMADYEDSISLDRLCLHMIDVQNDTEPPVISGLEESVSVLCGTNFNVKDYLRKNITINDNVTESVSEYSVTCDDDLYDIGSGNVKTTRVKDLTFVISAEDEAKNEAKREMVVSLKAIHVTKDDSHPTVYDGEYATIKVSSFKHGEFYGEKEYQFMFEVKNKMDKPLVVYLPSSTSINDYQVGAYYIVSSIAPGKTGLMESSISDSDIPDSIGDYNQIDSDVCLMEDGEDRPFYSIPIVFDTNAIE
ncbi:MAG: hypothetical protein Q4D71_07270 [Oscillospiraceae bacterium]|nr:hypothetical protein [Oscillospiraceae bacterium]